MTTTLVSYNINGFRSSLEKGILDWIETHSFDIVCMQETKTSESRVPVMLINEVGYRHCWHHAQRNGYSGVATLSRRGPDQIVRGMGVQEIDCEGRVLRTDFANLTLLNCYFPNGGSGDVRQQYKMRFLDRIYDHANGLLQEGRDLVVLGDYNIAHREIDIYDPVAKRGHSGFLVQEREWLSRWFELGMIDSFRHMYPDKIEYTWWSFAEQAKSRNLGWRIDYVSVSNRLRDKIVNVRHHQGLDFSDHCPVELELDL